MISSVSDPFFVLLITPTAHTAKATDENLTGEDWETVLNLCDKVQDEGEAGFASADLILLFTSADPASPVHAARSQHCSNVLHTAPQMCSCMRSPLQSLSQRTAGSFSIASLRRAYSPRVSSDWLQTGWVCRSCMH